MATQEARTVVDEGGDASVTEALADRVFGAVIATQETASIHLGGRLGLYRALAEGGPATPPELAGRTGTAARYVREWLEQQAVAGFLAVDDAGAPPDERRYVLPAAHRPVLADDTDLNYLTPLATLAVGVLRPIDALLDAYRGGGGVPYEDYGADTRNGIADINRPQFLNLLAEWVAAVPDVDARLRRQPPARVADLACGAAWSSIALARAYPDVVVDAVDVDAASIDVARANIAKAGLRHRVNAIRGDASDTRLPGRYDVVTIFEALHDMSRPVEALRAAREGLAEGGSVIVADERVAERFAPPGDQIERFNYGWSTLHCLAVALTDPGAAGTGAVMRPDTLRSYAAAAGFGEVEVLPIDNLFWRFYRLRP